MSDDVTLLVIFILGLIIGFLLGLIAMTYLRQGEELGYVLERNEKGLVTGVYAIPKPKK